MLPLFLQRRDNIKCECKDGLVGNGRTNCNSDIVSSLVNIEQTTWFRKVKKNLPFLKHIFLGKAFLDNLIAYFQVTEY
jgi:hypothetical protein